MIPYVSFICGSGQGANKAVKMKRNTLVKLRAMGENIKR